MEHHLGTRRDAELPLEILDRYLAETATTAERDAVERRLGNDAVERAAIERLQAAALYTEVERLSPAERSQLVSRAMGMTRPRFSVTRHNRVHRGSMHRWGWYAVAGLAAGVLGVIIGWDGHAHVGGGRSHAMSTYATTNGERANITLPDGATVRLSVASRLDVPVDYAAGNHTVRLVGEALFTVQQHAGTPFTVIAGGTTTRVLGTSFAVRHYATDTAATVTVRDGKVSVGSVVLTASQWIAVGPKGVKRFGPADGSQFAFASGVLQLPSMPLAQAVTELNRWYAADIRFGDPSLAQIPIKGKFTAGSLSDLTEMLTFMLDARVVRDGRVLTLYPRGGN